MRTLSSYPSSPSPRQQSREPNTMRSPSGFTRVAKPSMEDDDPRRMFELFESKAEVQILDSVADDALAASMYGGVKKNKKPKKPKKQKKGVSGYDFDSLIQEETEGSSSSSY